MNFDEHLEKYLNKDEINELIKSFDNDEQKGVLLNTTKMSKETFISLFPKAKLHPIIENAFLFDKNEYQLGKKIYHELGAYYIQDPSAMLVAHFLKPKKNSIILDLCAAPGGKTIGASLQMGNTGIIYANDLSSTRADSLLNNVERLGLGNVAVLSKNFQYYYKDFQNTFDYIILDAPCSGSGMFRKMNEMKTDWTYEKVLKCANIQKELILMCYSMLKTGGTLMYSTCSYSYEENEEIVQYLLSNSDAKLENIPHFNGEYRSKSLPDTVHLLPSLFKGEGQYIAKITKPGILPLSKYNEIEFSKKKLTKGSKPEIEHYILFSRPNEKLLTMSFRPGLLKEIKIGNDLIPSHHFSHFSSSEKSIPLSKEETIKYLKGESLIKNNIVNGYYFVSYLNMNIGVVHVVNNILKNLYPKGLRINAFIDNSF